MEPRNWETWLFGCGVAVLLVALWLRFQRDAPAPRRAEPAADPVAPAPGGGVRGAWLVVALRPVRAGLNLVTAVADCEITVTNDGDLAADAIRTGLVFLAAHADQSAAIEAANETPIVRSAVPAFGLAPGESRTFRSVASAPLRALPTMRAGGRDLIVPLVVLNLQHRDSAGVEHRTSQAFVLGVERVDSAKLAPFWVDSLRMVEQVAARPNGATLRRQIAQPV